MHPRVSVLMTAYNREALIADAIESVLAQTFTDFELIIVDDASKDRTVEIARCYAARDPRIQVVVNERNLGDYPNRNRAAKLASGEFIKYHDSDDVMYPHCLAVMAGMLAAYPEATVALSGEWPGGPLPMLLTPRMCYEREYHGRGMFGSCPASIMFRRDRFAELGYFELAGPHSDVAWWLRICKTDHVLLVPAGLYWWRLHTGQHWASPEAARDSAMMDKRVWAELDAEDCPLDAAGRHLDSDSGKQNLSQSSRGRVRHGMVPLPAVRPASARLVPLPASSETRCISRNPSESRWKRDHSPLPRAVDNKGGASSQVVSLG